MKKIVFFAVLLAAFVGAKAQTNIQEMYDFNRGHLTTTLEMFKGDNWGSTFFFTDIYHPDVFQSGTNSPTGYYTEISRALNFWQNTALAPLSLHVEWNGGQFANNCWLFGVEYFLHNSDFSNTLTLELMYKDIHNGATNIPVQFTIVWGMKDIFGVKGLVFSGFSDVWGEHQTWVNPNKHLSPEETEWVWLSEPQLWYNVGQHFGCENLFVGGEVELSYNFSGSYHPVDANDNRYANKGFNVAPCAGIKWIF